MRTAKTFQTLAEDGSGEYKFAVLDNGHDVGIYGAKSGNVLVTVPEVVESSGTSYAVKEIRSNVFEDCAEMEKIDLKGVPAIDSYNFINTMNLKSFSVNENNNGLTVVDGTLCSLEGELLFYPRGLERSEFVVPNDITRIGETAFMNCKRLKTVNIGSNVGVVGSDAFTGSGILNLELPESCVIEKSACATAWGICSNCMELAQVVLPHSMIEIPDYSFRGCGNLETIRLPDNLKRIGREAFGNSGLGEVDFPSNLEEIDEAAFAAISL